MTPDQKLDQMFRLFKQMPIMDEESYQLFIKAQNLYLDVNTVNNDNTETKSPGVLVNS